MRRFFSARVRAQIIKEFLSILRDKKSRMIIITPPLMQLLVFAFAATLEVKNIDLALVNQDPGRWGHEFSQKISHSYFVHNLRTCRNRSEADDLLERGEVLGTLLIPETFSERLLSNQKAEIQVVMDGRRGNASQITLGYLQWILMDINIERGLGDASQRLTIRNWFNPNLTYRWLIVPSLAGSLVMFSTLVITALSIARERELGTFDQLLVSPCTPSEIIFAKIVPAITIGLLLGMIMLSVGVFCFGIPFRGSALLLLLSLTLFILSNIGMGLMISSICETQQQAILGTFSIGVPAVLLSGFATPVENMPPFLQWVAEGIPLKHFLVIVQGSFLKAIPPEIFIRHTWPMALIFVMTFSASILFVRSRLQ